MRGSKAFGTRRSPMHHNKPWQKDQGLFDVTKKLVVR